MSCEFLHRTPDTSRTWRATAFVFSKGLSVALRSLSRADFRLSFGQVPTRELSSRPCANSHFLATPIDLGLGGKCRARTYHQLLVDCPKAFPFRGLSPPFGGTCMSDFKTVNSILDTVKRKRENKALPLVYSSVLANRFSHISTLYIYYIIFG